MKQVTKTEFFAKIGPMDVVTSCDYQRGDPEIRSLFKTRAGHLVGYTVRPLPTVAPDSTRYFLA